MSGGADRFEAHARPEFDEAADGKLEMTAGVCDDICELLRKTELQAGMSFAQTKQALEANIVTIGERLQQLSPRTMDKLTHTTLTWCSKKGWSLPGRDTSKPESQTR